MLNIVFISLFTIFLYSGNQDTTTEYVDTISTVKGLELIADNDLKLSISNYLYYREKFEYI